MLPLLEGDVGGHLPPPSLLGEFFHVLPQLLLLKFVLRFAFLLLLVFLIEESLEFEPALFLSFHFLFVLDVL